MTKSHTILKTGTGLTAEVERRSNERVENTTGSGILRSVPGIETTLHFLPETRNIFQLNNVRYSLLYSATAFLDARNLYERSSHMQTSDFKFFTSRLENVWRQELADYRCTL